MVSRESMEPCPFLVEQGAGQSEGKYHAWDRLEMSPSARPRSLTTQHHSPYCQLAFRDGVILQWNFLVDLDGGGGVCYI